MGIRIEGWRAVVVATGGIVFVVGLIAAAMSILENPAAEYDTASELLAADAVQRSWLPSFIPASATRIAHVHNLDTSEAWTAFSAPARVVDSLKVTLSVIPVSEVRRYRIGHPGG